MIKLELIKAKFEVCLIVFFTLNCSQAETIMYGFVNLESYPLPDRPV